MERVTGNALGCSFTTSVTPTSGIHDKPFFSEENVVSLQRDSDGLQLMPQTDHNLWQRSIASCDRLQT